MTRSRGERGKDPMTWSTAIRALCQRGIAQALKDLEARLAFRARRAVVFIFVDWHGTLTRPTGQIYQDSPPP